ncbi:uncharacterized protein [Amphiura filiformis]|uniref:uncharacterized protein n=1 Tax=Amphiura filiformis TaxID=82378 RepID=UPI003B225CB8
MTQNKRFGKAKNMENTLDKISTIAESSNTSFNEHCVICHNEYNQLKLLNCLHSFCQRCLEDKVGATVKGRNQEILCPLCGEETLVPEGKVELLPSNDIMQSNANQPSSSSLQLAELIKNWRNSLKQRIPKLKRVGTRFRHAAALAERFKKDSEQTASHAYIFTVKSQLLLESDDNQFIKLFPGVNKEVDKLISRNPRELPCVHNSVGLDGVEEEGEEETNIRTQFWRNR